MPSTQDFCQSQTQNEVEQECVFPKENSQALVLAALHPFYSSKNLQAYLSLISLGGDASYIWECPDILEKISGQTPSP